MFNYIIYIYLFSRKSMTTKHKIFCLVWNKSLFPHKPKIILESLPYNPHLHKSPFQQKWFPTEVISIATQLISPVT